MAAVVASDDEESFQVESSVWGHHVFQAVWTHDYFQAVTGVPSFLVIVISSFERSTALNSFPQA